MSAGRARILRCNSRFCAIRYFSALIFVFAFLSLSRTAFGQASAAEPAAPAGDPVSPDMKALQKARLSVEKFFEQSTNVVCAETVSQGIVGKNGKVNYDEDSIFDYQLQASTNTGSLKLMESRDTRKAAFRDSSRTLLITNGFTSMLLIMHPEYESSYTFTPAGQESVDGVIYIKVDFKSVPGAASPAALQLRDHNYPLPLSGTIWIEPQSGAVAKLVAAVDSSLSDLGLKGMRSEIHYARIQFHDPDESYWMPISAVIDVETMRQHWRNVHRFTGYKRFRATIRVENLETKP